MSSQLSRQEADGVQIQYLRQLMIKLILQMHGELPLAMLVTGTLEAQEVRGVHQHQMITVDSKIVVLLEEVEEVGPALNVMKKVTCPETVLKMLVVAVDHEDQEYASNVVMRTTWPENVQLQMMSI